MDDDFIAKLAAEEAALEVKLAAVRQLKAAYGVGPATYSAQTQINPPPVVVGAQKVAPRGPRSLASRMDKFGAYGQQIIDAAVDLLPFENESPMPTRTLLEKLTFRQIDVRGENKINALSAILARSSRIKGHGRSGWTNYGYRPPRAEYDPEIEALAGSPALKEIEPHSVSAGGSFTDHNPVRTGVVIAGSTPPWPSITS